MSRQPPPDHSRSLKMANADGAFATAFITLMGGSFMVGFIQLQHVNPDFWIGLLGAIGSLAGISQIPGGIFSLKFRSYKRFIFPGSLVWRLLYIPVALLPIMPVEPVQKLIIATLCIGVGTLGANFGNPVYNRWLAEMVPVSSRGAFFSRRNAIVYTTGAIAGLVGGLIVDQFKLIHLEVKGYLVVFSIGVVCAFISQFFFNLTGDVEHEPTELHLKAALNEFKRPLLDRRYQRTLVFLGCFMVGQTLAGNFFSAYALEGLHMSFKYIQGLGVLQALGTILTAKWWGEFIDQHGTRPACAIAAFGITLTPFMWILSVPGHPTFDLIIFAIGHTFSGIMFAGVNVSQFNIMMATAPPNRLQTFLGTGLAIQTVLAGIAPLVGALILHELRPIGTFEAYKGLFACVVLLRSVAFLMLFRVRERGSSAIRHSLRNIRPAKG